MFNSYSKIYKEPQEYFKIALTFNMFKTHVLSSILSIFENLRGC